MPPAPQPQRQGNGRQNSQSQSQDPPDSSVCKLYCTGPACSAWVYSNRGVRFCHKCGHQFELALGSDQSQRRPDGPRPQGSRRRGRSYASVAAAAPGRGTSAGPSQRRSAHAPQPAPPQDTSASAPKPRAPKEQTALAKARAEVQFYSSTYGPDSEEFQAAAAKLRRLKQETLQAKSLPAQARSLQDQIQSAKARWRKVNAECEQIESEVERLCARFDQLDKQNQAEGDEIEAMEAQLEVVQRAIDEDPDQQPPSRPPKQPGHQPQTPEQIASVLQTAYEALRSAQLPTVTQVSSDALAAVLAEVQASASLVPRAQPTAGDGQASDRHERRSWSDSLEEEEDRRLCGMDDSEPFEEGAGVPLYDSDDPAAYINPAAASDPDAAPRLGSFRSRRVITAIRKSRLDKKFETPALKARADEAASSCSHRGPGSRAAEGEPSRK